MSALIILLVLAATPQPVPIGLSGPWTVQIGPGILHAGEREVTLDEPVMLDIQPPQTLHALNERHTSLPVFNEKAGGWRKGARLSRLIAQECTATGLLIPASVVVRPAPGQPPFILGADYAIDGFWATVGRLEDGAIAPDQEVCIDYDYRLSRIDTICVDAANKLTVVKGEPAVALAMPPSLPPDLTAVANLYVRGGIEKLDRGHLYPIQPVEAPAPAPVAEKLLPKTLAKLRAGQTLTIVAFGDSVTDGGGVDNPEDWYQNQFLTRLQRRFPEAKIQMLTAAWGGASSKRYIQAPPGGEHDFGRDVLQPKPDLVTIEFVNDAYLDEAGVARHYAGIVDRIRGVGAEIVLITPHLVRPDWMPVENTLFTEDPRPYVKGLKEFAAQNNIALADAGARWCRLRAEGIPYQTLLANDINHPDPRGHAIFADVLMGLFPEK